MVGTIGVVGEEAATSGQQAFVLTPRNGLPDVAGGRFVRAQCIRFSHCHSAIDIANDTVINSRMVATMDGYSPWL